MTRKRFVKLLMSRGFDRAESAEVAQVVKMAGGCVSYAAFYDDGKILYVIPSIRAVSKAMKGLRIAMAFAAVAFQEFAEAEKFAEASKSDFKNRSLTFQNDL